MGFGNFFNNIKTGLGSAVSWVSNNSGTIGAAAGIIAKIAGNVAVEDLAAFEEGDDVVNLQRNYNAATAYIESQADANINSNAPSVTVNSGGMTQTTTARLTGVWTSPSFIQEGELPAVDIVQDVSKFLHQQCMPTIFSNPSGPGSPISNLGQLICQAAFRQSESQSEITNVQFNISLDDQGSYMAGAHAYYSLPLGLGGTNEALHSCISLKCVTVKSFREAQAAHLASVHVFAPQAPSTTGGSGWLTTFKIIWTSAELSLKFWAQIRRILQQAGNQYAILYNTTAGNVQVTKILAPEGVTPARTKNDLTNAISQALAQQNSPPMISGPASISSNMATQLPQITIENTTLDINS